MNPTDFAQDVWGIAGVALLLGVKHGFDADHLAAIDGLTRYNAAARPRLARAAGALFSLGHGCVVVIVALAASAAAHAWQVPGWLEAAGAWISIVVLTLLALLNVATVWRTPAHHTAHVVGWRSGVFGGLLACAKPAWVMGVGALFALSFDTLSQAALFAVVATQFGGWQAALLLGCVFIAGMLLTDGINGLWISRLIHRSDATSRIASRTMALAIAGVALLTAGLGVAKQMLPGAATWLQGKELWIGVALAAVVAVSFAVSLRLSRGAASPRNVAIVA